MIDGFRFPRFDREDFMASLRGGDFQIGMLAASLAPVNRRPTICDKAGRRSIERTAMKAGRLSHPGQSGTS